MAERVSQLTELTSGQISSLDEIYVRDVSEIDPAMQSKRSTIGNASFIGTSVMNIKTLFGAVGDGVTDDSDAFASAIAAAAAIGAGLYIPAGRYKIDDDLTSAAVTVRIYGEGDASILDFSGGGSLTLQSALTTLPDLSVNVVGGANLLTFGSAHGLVAGDVFLIYNPTDYSFGSHRAYYRDGCMFRVSSVPSTTTLKIYTTAPDAYTAASMDVYKLNGGPVVIKDIQVVPTTSGKSLVIDGHVGVRLDNVTVAVGSDNTAIEFTRSFDISVSRPGGVTRSGDAYPMVFANCQHIVLSNVNLRSTRHCIAFGGGDYAGAVPTRDALVVASILENDSTLGIGAGDMHGNCENIHYIGCIIRDHGNIAGRNVSYKQCTIYGRNPTAFADGCGVYGSEVVGGLFEIIDCHIITYGNLNTFAGIDLDVTGITKDFRLRVINTTIECRASAAANARSVRIEVGSASPPSSQIDIELDGVTYIGPNATLTVVVSGTNDVSATMSISITRLTAPTGSLLVGASLGANLNASMRMPRLHRVESINTPGGSSFQASGSTWTYRYIYPRSPTIITSVRSSSGSAQSGVRGGKTVVASVRSYSDTSALLQISSGDGANFTSTEAAGVVAVAFIEDF